MQDDDLKKPQNGQDDTSATAAELSSTKYADGLYNDNPNVDYIDNPDDLNNLDAPLDAGTGDDADGDYDIDDSTLPAENDSDETETGMDDVDFDNIPPQQGKTGDTVMEPEVGF